MKRGFKTTIVMLWMWHIIIRHDAQFIHVQVIPENTNRVSVHFTHWDLNSMVRNLQTAFLKESLRRNFITLMQIWLKSVPSCQWINVGSGTSLASNSAKSLFHTTRNQIIDSNSFLSILPKKQNALKRISCVTFPFIHNSWFPRAYDSIL